MTQMPDQRLVCLPPDPNPRPPGYTLPAGACDTHFHVFGPPHKFPFSEARRYTPPAAPFEHYQHMQRITGLSRGVVVQPTAHGVDNSAILDAIARADGRLRGVINMDAGFTDDDLERLHAGGIRGARFSLMSDRAGSKESIAAAIPRLARMGWSLDLHIEPEHLIAEADFVRAIPVPVVIDHIGRIDPADGLDQPAMVVVLELLEDARFWVKISGADKLSGDRRAHVEKGLPFTDFIPYARAVIAAAPDRVIWGTDWPHSNIFEAGCIAGDGDLLDLLAEYAPDEAVRNRILVDNPARLYGFED
jgi:predicted TIM-barrel fold metal-dependent hydrolase